MFLNTALQFEDVASTGNSIESEASVNDQVVESTKVGVI